MDCNRQGDVVVAQLHSLRQYFRAAQETADDLGDSFAGGVFRALLDQVQSSLQLTNSLKDCSRLSSITLAVELSTERLSRPPR